MPGGCAGSAAPARRMLHRGRNNPVASRATAQHHWASLARTRTLGQCAWLVNAIGATRFGAVYINCARPALRLGLRHVGRGLKRRVPVEVGLSFRGAGRVKVAWAMHNVHNTAPELVVLEFIPSVLNVV